MEKEDVVPFVGILTPYGDTRVFDLIYEGVVDETNLSPVFVITDSIQSSISFAEYFRDEFNDINPEVLTSSTNRDSKRDYNAIFTTPKILLEVIIDQLKDSKHIINIISHIFYFVPNRVPYDMKAYMNLKILKDSRKFLNLKIPKVTLFAINTACIPKIGSQFTIFNKHITKAPVKYELFGKVKNNLYEEMARWILRTHIEDTGRTIVVVLPTYEEIDNISGILDNISTKDLIYYNIYRTSINEISQTPDRFTKIILATNEVLPLITIPVDILLDSYRDIVSGKTLSGLETIFCIPTPKEVALNRSTILRRPRDDNFVAVDTMMASVNEFEGKNLTPVQSISKYFLMIGLTSLNSMNLWPLNNTVHVRLSELQSYGALNPDYRTTSLGKFLLDIDLSPSEGTVLWTYIQEHWDSGKSCLSVMLLTSMISLFSSTQNYFEYRLPILVDNLEETKYKRKKWDKFAGVDDIETFLNLWYHLIIDLGTFDLDYETIQTWCRENSINSDKMYAVYKKVEYLKQNLEKYGFICDEESIDLIQDLNKLRKIYSKVYVLKRMESVRSGIYQGISDQQSYTIYSKTSINTTSITEPPEIVGIITKDKYIFLMCLYRS